MTDSLLSRGGPSNVEFGQLVDLLFDGSGSIWLFVYLILFSHSGLASWQRFSWVAMAFSPLNLIKRSGIERVEGTVVWRL